MVTLPNVPETGLTGKRALVTGAGRGIGLAAATALAAARVEVVLLARSKDEIDAAAQAMRDKGWNAQALCLDVQDIVNDPDAIHAAGRIDILVNNAGTNRPKPMWDVTPDDYDAVMGLNLKSAFFVAQAVAASMIAGKRKGSLIHISSQMGHVGGANRSLYCASKWGLEGMSKSMAIDLAGHGIRSNTIAPTFIETPMTKPFLMDPEFRQMVLQKIKLGRLGQVEDIMGAVTYLASEASSLVTGTSMLIDGGWTAD